MKLSTLNVLFLFFTPFKLFFIRLLYESNLPNSKVAFTLTEPL